MSVGDEQVGAIGPGFCVLVGVGRDDDEAAARLLASKVARLRVFTDDQGKMNLDLQRVGGAVLAVSQFTLYGDARRGHRPSFAAAMEPLRAQQLFELFCNALGDHGVTVQTGRFRASMQVEICNDGPVTILLDTDRQF